MLAEYDTDKDGFISLSEFIGDVRGEGKATEIPFNQWMICLVWVSSAVPISHPINQCSLFFGLSEDFPSQWEIEETVRFKDLYDQDKDGKLNRDEQLRWVAPNSYGSAREEVWLNWNNWCVWMLLAEESKLTENSWV